MGRDRDFDVVPYTRHEAQVATFLSELGVGGGEDPVGFILASHAELARRNGVLRRRLAAAGLSTSVEDDGADPGVHPDPTDDR